MRNTTVAVSRVLALLAAFLTVSVVGGILFAGLFLPAVGATGNITRGSIDWFESLDQTLAEPPLSQGSTMYASDGKTVIAHFYEENRVVTSLNRIAPVMRQAIVAIEDSRFYEHGGVDPRGLFRAFVNNQFNDSGQIQGASTLTQQYIKNVLLESAIVVGDKAAAEAAVAKDNSRKIREIRMAIQLEKQRSKNGILEDYLNIANFGSNNYGVEAASQYFFRTTAAKLTLSQSALLAGLVQSPETYNPFRHPKAAKERRDTVLTRMRDLGMIKPAQYTAARGEALPDTPQPALSGCVTARQYAYFCSYALSTLRLNNGFKALGVDGDARMKAVKRGGLKIITTLDATLQTAATKALMTKVPPADASGVAAVSVTVEPGTGKVLSIAQNRYYSNVVGPGQTEVSYGVDDVYGGSGGFQTGSTSKAFTLADWLAKGKGLYDTVNGDLSKRPFSDFTSCGKPVRGGVYSFSNSEGGGVPSIDVLRATYASVNTAFVDIESRLDLCDITKLSQSLGVHLARAQNVCGEAAASTNLPTCLPSLTLGVKELSPMSMAFGYAAFGADGLSCQPLVVTAITDRAGKAKSVPQPVCTQAITPEVAHGVTYALKRVITQGTAKGISPVPWPAAGKTGTTDESFNTWFVGYTAQRSTAVLVTDPKSYPPGVGGHKDDNGRRPGGQVTLNDRTIGKKRYGQVFGATIAAPLWKTIMTTAMTGLPDKDWPNPPTKMLEGSGIKVPNLFGHPIDEARGILQDMGFRVRVGDPVPSEIIPGYVGKQAPSGGRMEPGGVIVLYPGDGSQSPQGVDGGGGGPGPVGDPGNGNGGFGQ